MRLLWVVEHSVWTRPNERRGALEPRIEQQTRAAVYRDAIVTHGYFYAIIDRIANCVLPPRRHEK